MKVSLLDYGAGNTRSVRNAITACGYEIEEICTSSQIDEAEVIVFPGVGSFGTAMLRLKELGFINALKRYLSKHDRPYLGICLGMQTLFEKSEEDYGEGLSIIKGDVVKFDDSQMAVPHIGWNGKVVYQESPVFSNIQKKDVYFVHSYYAPITNENKNCVLAATTYSGKRFISAVQIGSIVATQFHPEKSGSTGLAILKNFLDAAFSNTLSQSTYLQNMNHLTQTTQLTKRVVVALDVRSNDEGDLVVTKGDQYDVREKETSKKKGSVRNLGKPVALASRYYQEGADEIAFLNITSFRSGVIDDMPMLKVLEEASKTIFVPLTVGGGIRSYMNEESGTFYSALEVASRYFRAGADKVSIGSDAVYAAEEFIRSGNVKSGKTSIEMISKVYGVQAVVVSIDPKRVYVDYPQKDGHTVIQLPPNQCGPNGEKYCWYQCTVKGGREERNICAVAVAFASQQLGAGEIMLNCIDMDGQCCGFDHVLMKAVSQAVTIPIIASSGAGKPCHFTNVFSETNVQAALAAGMFHRKEVEIMDVKKHMEANGIPTRR